LERQRIIPAIIKTHHAAQRFLKPRLMVNPFGFPSTHMLTRRDNLIATACFLRQYQKPIKTTKPSDGSEPVEYIECDLEDYRIAYKIMTGGVNHLKDALFNKLRDQERERHHHEKHFPR
jgi:hypothetical protein